ncbi:MAG TPA: LysM peptidoglycan-binding domain-containing protein, partial [Tepidimicrobium sp.]|nr:LysM peptidoglycan-binding domain-containing protein [Tepidimicrobium sp.]
IKLTAPDIVVAGDMPRPVAVGVRPGDTLWSIAVEFYHGIPTGEAVYMIRQANPGIDPGRLQVGQRVILPEVLGVVYECVMGKLFDQGAESL